MLSPNEFAAKVLTSIGEIRGRVARVEEEVKHIRHHVNKLQAAMEAHASAYAAGNSGSNGTFATVRLSRKALGRSGILGGVVVTVMVGIGKALGWW